MVFSDKVESHMYLAAICTQHNYRKIESTLFQNVSDLNQEQHLFFFTLMSFFNFFISKLKKSLKMHYNVYCGEIHVILKNNYDLSVTII